MVDVLQSVDSKRYSNLAPFGHKSDTFTSATNHDVKKSISFQECFQFVCETLPHALDVLNEAKDRVTEAHIKVCLN